jgi:adenine phosphoribosyltransferase
MGPLDEAKVRSCIRVIEDWPKPGVSFQDLSGVMADADAFRLVIHALASRVDRDGVDVVVGIEARGFPYGAALAHHLGAGFVTMRKPGKLPGAVHAREYELEYGTATLELHQDAVGPGHRVVIVDDVLATGGTALAAFDLVATCGADVRGLLVVMDLPFLGGRARVEERGLNVQAVLTPAPA